MTPFIPMLAATCKDLDALKFPVMASIKLDGVRCTVQNGKLLSRTLKPIPNKAIQKLFSKIPQGLDGELIYGDPVAPDCYRNTVSVVMSEDKPADGITFYIFDQRVGTARGFFDRYHDLVHLVPRLEGGFAHYKDGVMDVPRQRGIKLLPHKVIVCRAFLDVFESVAVGQGHEGVMVRSMNGPYKEGRSTQREGYLLKIKRFADSEAVVLGVTELMHNANEAKTNELGRTARSSHKEGKVGTGTLGALCVRDVKTGVEFEIGTGFTAAERADLWAARAHNFGVIGRLAKYKYFATGSKDKPRFPVFLGWRDKRDV